MEHRLMWCCLYYIQGLEDVGETYIHVDPGEGDIGQHHQGKFPFCTVISVFRTAVISFWLG